MASSIAALVEPELLTWARTSANLEPIAAARKISVPEGRIEEWEDGTTRPTITQLRRAAAVYKRSLAVFFLPAPPTGFETLRDFRLLVHGSPGEWSAALHAEYRRAHLQRDALLDIFELDDDEPPTVWRIEWQGDDAALAEAARSRLRAESVLRVPTAGSNEFDHLNYWTNGLEESGVLVMATEGGEVAVNEMRAFSLYFDEVPVVVLNGADSARGRLFSLVHEYAHLLLHTEGLCDMTTDTRATSTNRRLEARCNELAATILMPRDVVMRSPLVRAHEADEPWSLSDLVEAAKPFGVSVEAFLRRLVTLGRVELAAYQQFREEYGSGGAPTPRASGGNFYYTKARDLGKGYVRRVAGAHQRTLIDSTTAATYLDVKVGQIARLAEVAQV